MDKPRAFVHFEQTRAFDEMGVLAIGRLHIPTVVLIVFTALMSVILTVVSGVMVETTGDSDWWMLIGWFGIGVGALSVIGGLASLLAWMGRALVRANS